MYSYNNQDTDDNSSQYNVNFQQYHSIDNPSFDELPTQFLDNQQLESHGFMTDSLFDMNNNNWDYYDFEQQSQFIDPQEAILFSDPNFLRQHQLLQEEHTRLQPENTNNTSSATTTNNTTTTNNNNNNNNNNAATTIEEGKKQQQKRSHRRQQVFGKSLSAQDNDKIDHQRRFNELQARFRINYSRKPTQSQSKSKKSTSKESSSDESLKKSPPTKIDLPPSSNVSPIPTVLTTPPPVPGGTVMSPPKRNSEEFTMTKEYMSSSFPSRTMPIQIHRVSRGNASHHDAESYQKQLDNQLDKVDFNDITVSELKEMLRQRGKPATGKKAILLQRLQEEREVAKSGRSPIRTNRHSQPLPLSYNSYSEVPQRPNSFQASSSSPIIQNDIAFLTPGSPGGQLNRSIANMHIGSPPTASRRYSPYSPRLGSSPKSSYFEYSSSVPLTSGNLSTSPNPTTPNNNQNSSEMMLLSSYSASRLTPGRYYNNTKSYKPFTSSALATPDRDEDINPFDAYYAGGVDPPIKEEEYNETPECNNYQDWSDPTTYEMMLKQQVLGPLTDDVVLSDEQIMALLNSQQQAAAQNFKLDDSHLYQHFPV